MRPDEYFSTAVEDVRQCHLCGAKSDEWATLAVRDRFSYPVQTQGCMVCGLVFISPRMSASDYAQFYATGDYRRTVAAHCPAKVPLEETQRNYARLLSTFLSPALVHWKGATVLDVGGSTGIVADQMRTDFDMVPTVLELSKDEIAQARARGIEAIEGSIDDFVTDRTWDIVMICQSIDHFLNPRAVLDKVRTLIRPGGLLFVDIADVSMLVWRNRCIELSVKLDHPVAFTLDTMGAFLEQTGFVAIHCGEEKHACKRAFLCRRDLPRPGVLPKSSSVTRFFAMCHRVRMDQNESRHDVRVVS